MAAKAAAGVSPDVTCHRCGRTGYRSLRHPDSSGYRTSELKTRRAHCVCHAGLTQAKPPLGGCLHSLFRCIAATLVLRYRQFEARLPILVDLRGAPVSLAEAFATVRGDDMCGNLKPGSDRGKSTAWCTAPCSCGDGTQIRGVGLRSAPTLARVSAACLGLRA